MRVDAGSNANATNRTTNRRGLALLLAGAAGLVLSQVVLPKAHAQQTGGVQAWEASANSAVVGISPSSSGVYLTSTIGQAYAAYDQTETQATSALLNLGGLGYAVAASPVCGQSYSLSQQPQALTADSSNGPSTATTQAQLFPGVRTPQGSGTEHVSVSVKPEAAEARTYPVTQTVPGVLDVEGVAQSEVHYVDGTAQEASSSVTENLSLLGGKVSIDGLSWSASQQRGGAADPTSRASFSYSTITVQSVAGIPITIPGSVPISTALAQVNNAIGIVGLSISAPMESVDPGTGGISMSPLQVHFSGSSLDNQLASPTVGPLTQVVNQINGQVTHGTDCSNIKNLLGELSTSPETGLNLLISGFSGSGAVDLFFGGASADTLAAPSFSNPFDFGGAAGSAPLPPSGAFVAPAIASDSGFANNGVPAASAATASPAAAPSSATPSSEQRPMAIGAVRCTTTSPKAHAGCWRGLATWAAGAVVVLGGGLLVADAVYSHRQPPSRRRRRRFLV
jgi:hypothetical protein